MIPNPKHVLIIDDEPVMRKLLEQILKSKYHVTTLENGQEALNWMYSGNIPDLVVADLKMPVIDGFEYSNGCAKAAFFRMFP